MELNLKPTVRTEISMTKKVVLGTTIIGCITAVFFAVGNMVSSDSRASGTPETYNVWGNSKNSTNLSVWNDLEDNDTIEITSRLMLKDDLDLSGTDLVINIDGGELFWDDAYRLSLSASTKILLSNGGELMGKSSKLDSDMEVYFGNAKTISWDGTDAIYSFDDINGTGGYDNGLLPLPVDLILFETEVIPGGVALRWATAAEINNSHFEVQRSFDGQDYEVIKIIEGKGNTVDRVDYAFVDSDIPPKTPSLYYRLKQIDYDGGFEILPVEVVRLDAAVETALVYPNPADQFVKVTREDVEFTAQILERSGGIIDQQNSVDRSVQFNTAGIPNGIYFVNIVTIDNRAETQRIIIRH